MIIYSDEKQIFNNVKNEWYDAKKIPCFKYCSKIYARKEEILSLLKEVVNINTDNIAFDEVTVKITGGTVSSSGYDSAYGIYNNSSGTITVKNGIITNVIVK